jgi:sugar phosphate isomerase/epimerase
MTPKESIELGFCWSFPDDTPENGLARLRAYGFEGIELWPNFLEQWGIEHWAKALNDNGMRCFQLCPYFNFVHGEEKIVASRKMLHDYLEAAKALNCARLRVFTGPPWGDGVVGAHEATEAQWQSAIDSLREFCEIAAREGVELCLECHEGSLMEDASSTMRLIESVGHPNLTVNLQLPLLNEEWQVSLEALAIYTTHIHIHNWTQGLGEGELTYLAKGVFDWEPVIRYLLELNRQVCLSVEHPDHGEGSWKTAEVDGAFLQEFRERF